MNTSAFKKTFQHLPKLLFGFIIISIGTQLTLHANLGMNPWGTFHQGVSLISDFTFGEVSQLTGLAIILLSLFLKIYPGIGTLLNMYLLGFFIDTIEAFRLIPSPDTIFMKTIYLIVGTFLFNYGVYIYLSCELGAGPRDGLLVGLVRITGYKVSIIRPIIEITVITIGVILGGTFGIGTLLNAFAGGYILNTIFDFHNFNPKTTRQMIITDYLR